MNKVPNYSHHTWEQLQDALTSINSTEQPAQFAAIHAEIERRLNTPPIAAPNQLSTTSSVPENRRWMWALCGWLWGFCIGIIASPLTYSFFTTRFKLDGQGTGFYFVAYGWAGMLLCSTIGLLVGLRLSRPA